MAEKGARNGPRQFGASLVYVLGLLSVGIVVSGTNSCRDDYYLGSQTSATPSPTTGSPTASPTVTSTRTPQSSPSPTPTPTELVDPTETQFAAIGVLDSDSVKGSLKAAMGKAGNGVIPPSDGISGGGPRAQANPNWLGGAFVQVTPEDTDSDGFTDTVESSLGTDPKDPVSMPSVSCRSEFTKRFRGVDDDEDGLSNAEEARFGTNSHAYDTDQDGCGDGSEVLSGSSPTDPASMPASQNHDCLSDAYKQQHGLKLSSADSDGDSLDDAEEIAFGSDPLAADSDGDGVYDWREIERGCDPLRRDFIGK